jgi:uncharacterized protein (DUF305 family)
VRIGAPGALLLAVLAGPACRATGGGSGPTLVQPGAPGQPTRETTVERSIELGRVPHTAADVRFMQGMISHHAQALEMTALLGTRTMRPEMKLLARRIDDSQTDEIGLMERWLKERGETSPGAHAHHAPGAPLMPGMLTPEELQRLAAARGDAFDRLFLELMIKHHEGALFMVGELFSTAGAAQETEIFAFASDVDADQRIEIRRMSALLQEFLK